MRVAPQWYDPKAPVLRMTRWHGISTATGFLPTAVPTARVAPAAPRPVEGRPEPKAEAPVRSVPTAVTEGPNGERLGAAAAAALAMTERALARVRARAA